jgi:hypothetical protein
MNVLFEHRLQLSSHTMFGVVRDVYECSLTSIGRVGAVI